MSVTLRQASVVGAVTAGRPLTYAEMDANFIFTQSGDGAVSRTVLDKARDFVHAKDFGAVGDGVTDDDAAIQAAIDASGGAVQLGAGTFIVSTSLLYKTGLQLIGAGTGLTILKHKGDYVGAILSGGSPDSTYQNAVDIYLQDITFDGRWQSATVNGGTIVHAYQANKFRAVRCDFINSNGYGVGLEGTPADSNVYKRGPSVDVSFYDCQFRNNGWKIDGTSNSADGIDIKWSRRVLFVRCHAEGNSDKGFNPRGRQVTMIACTAVNNVTGIAPGMIDPITTTTTLSAGISATDTTIPLTSAAHLPLFGIVVIDGERISYSDISGDSITGCIRGYGSAAAASHLSGATVSNDDTEGHINLISCFAEGNSGGGIAAVANGTAATDAYIVISDCHSRNNGSSGIGITAPASAGVNYVMVNNCVATGNAQHGLSGVTVAGLQVNGGFFNGNTTDGIRLDTQAGASINAHCMNNGGSGIRLVNTCSDIDAGGSVLSGNSGAAMAGTGYTTTRFIRGATKTVTAAATTTLPTQRPKVQVNGNTTITSITATFDGDFVILRFTGTPTVTDGSNLKLNGDFVASADDCLALTCDGTNWFEVSRSAN